MSRLNVSNFKHPAMRAKLDIAMRDAVANSLELSELYGQNIVGRSYLANSQGDIILSIRHYRGEPQALQFYAAGAVNVTADVLKAIRS